MILGPGSPLFDAAPGDVLVRADGSAWEVIEWRAGGGWLFGAAAR